LKLQKPITNKIGRHNVVVGRSFKAFAGGPFLPNCETKSEKQREKRKELSHGDAKSEIKYRMVSENKHKEANSVVRSDHVIRFVATPHDTCYKCLKIKKPK